MNKFLLLLLCVSSALFVTAQKTPKREMRGAWISTHLGLDWPVGSQTPAQQRAALVSYLDEQKQTGVNAIFFQVRSQADALYPSQIEPWSYVLNGNSLTGRQDVDPLWDPLQFALEETHKRGMEFHAWMNPYRAVATASQLTNSRLFTARHVAKRKPEWLINTGATITVDPAIPAVRDYIIDVIEEVVNNYDIDGLHFDDYFYPPSMTLALDQNSYNTYATPEEKILYPNTTTGRANWRRENVNRFIEQVHQTVGTMKPWVKFGVSPTGIYRNGVANGGSATAGSEHYNAVYADSKKWLQEGWVDYIAPQVYWHIGFSIADYAVLVPWWNNNAFGKHIYIGMASYKVNMTFGSTGNGPIEQAAWKMPTQYPNELRMNRDASYQNVLGELHFRVAFLRANALGHRDSIRQNIYKKTALLPVMNWKDLTAPATPSDLAAEKKPNNSTVLTWEAPAAGTTEYQKVKQFAVYRSETAAFQLEDTAYLLGVTDTDVPTYTDNTADPSKTYYYAVTALNRLHVESAAAITDLLPPVITCPGQQTVSVDNNCAFLMPDYRSQATASDDVSAPGQIVITQVPAAGATVSGKGNHTVTLTATDASGKSASCTFTVTALDELPPVISNVTVDPAVLFPANHKMRNVTVGYTATDNCGPLTTALTVTSNEDENATGDGDTESDWQVMDAHKLKLRAERSGSGEGRIYTITITATDGSGNQSVQTVTVAVPHDRSDITRPSTRSVAEMTAPQLLVAVQQNPVAHQFLVRTQSPTATSLNIKVMDAAGRVVESRSGVPANGQFELGRSFRAGVYFLQVTQGTAVQTMRLVKTSD